MSVLRLSSLFGVVLALAACVAQQPSQVPAGAAAYAVAPAPDPAAQPAVRTLRSGDEIAVQVYREPDLGGPRLVIDDQGLVQLPLLGSVEAAGFTPVQLAERIQSRYGERYLKDPRVTVALTASIAPTVAVEGQVASPGVFPISRNETLLSALSRAGSLTRVARLDEVVVFRTVDGQRMGGRFDVAAIRAGAAADPRILDGDVVVVGYSQIQGAYRDFLQTAPLLSLFTVF